MTRATSDPLFDTLFRPTGVPPRPVADTSAAPVREPGTRTRAGNAMNRTRAALLDGAARAVAADGTRITMARVAAAAGVAKATLYNHFRTREAVLAALLEARLEALTAAQAGKKLPEALRDAALALSADPVLAALRRLDPATLLALATVDPHAAGWRVAQAAVDDAVRSAGRGGAGTVLRWLAGQLVTPSTRGAVESDVAVLVAGLPYAVVARGA